MRTQLHSRPSGLQDPFGVQNPNSPKALQLPYDPRIVLPRFVQIITHKILRHQNVPFPLLPERRSFTARQGGLRTHPTSEIPRLGFGLTGRPSEGKLRLSSYQPSRQTGFGCSMKASLLIKRGFRAFTPNTEYTIPYQSTLCRIIFAPFAFCVFFAIPSRRGPV